MKVLAVICLAFIGYASGAGVCNTPLDVVLVVEDSSFLPDDNVTMSNLRAFLGAIVNNLKIDQQHDPNPFDQAAYVLYNTTQGTTSVFNLNTHKEGSDAKSAVLRQQFSRTFTSSPPIEAGLSYAWNTALTVTNGERSCYGTVVILVSYSSYDDPNKFGVGADKATQERLDLTAARRLTESGALIITVGIGSKRNVKHLQDLATDPSYYFDYQDFTFLGYPDVEGNKIANLTVCTFVPKGVFYPGEVQTVQADFTFVVDVSNAFTQDLADDISAFLNNFLTPFTYDHVSGVQASLVTYGSAAKVAVGFGDADNLDQFLSKTKTAFTAALACPLTEERCVDQALERVNYEVFVPPYYRPYSTIHYVFIFTAGCFNCLSATVQDPIDLARMIKSPTGKAAEIFVVPLRSWKPPQSSAEYPFAFWKEPLEIATDYSHLWEAQADPKNILTNYLHKQAWRNVFYSISQLPPPPTTTAGPTTEAGPSTSAAATTTAGPPPQQRIARQRRI